MCEEKFLVLTGEDVESLLAGEESALIELVRLAYEAHYRGETSLPQSSFLRFPDDQKNRIIALPAFVAGENGGAGIKWISSFPGNVHRELARASAVVILNSMETGRPTVLMEGSILSAKRTAASAALAARVLHRQTTLEAVGVIGCGVINFEIQRFLLSTFPFIRRLYLYDLSPDRADLFKWAFLEHFEGVTIEVVRNVDSVLRSAPLVSLATTATTPHITDLSALPEGATILHISLRDLAPELILACDNVADDIDHVCRAQTSVHLAEQQSGSREFVRCALAEITGGLCPARRDDESVAVFNPFGLGVLDVAVGEFIHRKAIEEGRGTEIDSFFPDSLLSAPSGPLERVSDDLSWPSRETAGSLLVGIP